MSDCVSLKGFDNDKLKIRQTTVNFLLHADFSMDKGIPMKNGHSIMQAVHDVMCTVHFYAPGLKGPPGASSNRIVHPFVCP